MTWSSHFTVPEAITPTRTFGRGPCAPAGENVPPARATTRAVDARNAVVKKAPVNLLVMCVSSVCCAFFEIAGSPQPLASCGTASPCEGAESTLGIVAPGGEHEG